MKVEHNTRKPNNAVEMEGASGCHMRMLIGESDAAPNFAMRQFEIEPGGHTPKHHHPYEHECYILEGEGTILDGDTPKNFSAGDVIYVAPDDIHQFRNTGSGPLRFLCLVPNSSAGKPITVVPE